MMRYSFLAILPLFLAACASSGPDNSFPEIPTLEIGGSGARFMTDANTPYAAYNKAYAQLTKLHYEARRNHSGFGNPVAVTVAIRRIVRNLKVMRSHLVNPDPSSLDPIIAFYEVALKRSQQGRISGITMTKLDMYRRKVKITYGPSEVSLKGFSGTKDETGKKPGKKSTDKKIAKTGDELPPPIEKGSDTTKEDPNKADTGAPKKEGNKPVVKKDKRSPITYRVFFKAWQKSHEDLAAAFAKKGDTKAPYEEIVESLRGLKAQLSTKEQGRLQVYVSFYEKIYEDTKAFTTIPEGASSKDVLNDLRIVAGGIQKDFDPAKRK